MQKSSQQFYSAASFHICGASRAWRHGQPSGTRICCFLADGAEEIACKALPSRQMMRSPLPKGWDAQIHEASSVNHYQLLEEELVGNLKGFVREGGVD